MSSTDHLSELDLLRGQVADLSRELAERDHVLREQSLHLERERQDVHERSEMLRAIVEGTAAETGEGFFTSLVTHLTLALHVHYAVIGEVLEAPFKKIRTLAVSAGGALADNFEYELAHTPCATALTQTFTCFDRDVQITFPQFQRVTDFGAESYCAVPLRTKSGAVIGLLVVMDTKPLEHSDYLQSLLGVFAPRIASEFERRQAEQERIQALADLHNVMETVPDVMFTLDTQGNMVRWNRRVRDVTGYSSEELLNKPALTFVPPEEQTSTAAAIQRALTEGYAELEGHLLTKDHHLIPYHWTAALLKGPHGESIGIIGVGRDVSDKKRAEEELRQQYRRLVDAQALAHLGSWDWDIDTDEVQWSDEQFRIFGYEPGASAVRYDTFLASLLPDDHDRVLATINDALLGTRPYDVECRIVRPNGAVRSIHVRVDVYRDATGHPLSMAGTVLDITERKRAEEALRKSEERYARATAAGKVGVWELDVATGTYHGDSNLKGLFGYVGDELSTDPYVWLNLVHPDDQSIAMDHWQRIVNGERDNYNYELRMLKKDGTVIWTDVRGHAVRSHDGQVTQLFGATVDITERKKAQDALVQSERQIHTVLDALPVGVWFTDQSGKPLLANPAAKQIWSNITQIGMQTPNKQSSWWETIGPVNEPHRWALSQTLTTGVPSLNEILDFECLDGTKKVIRNSTVPVQDKAGNILGAIVLNEDITTLRRAQEALLLTQFSVDHAVEGFFWIGPDARILHVNDAACRMLEYTRDELTAMTVHDIDPSFLPEFWPTHWGELKQKGSMTVESKHWSRTGSVLETEVTFNYLQYDGKDYNCAIMRDIGERKRAEVELRRSEAFITSVVENLPNMIFVKNAKDLKFVRINKAGEQLLGYSREALIGTSAYDHFPKTEADCFTAHDRQVLASGRLLDIPEEPIETKLEGRRILHTKKIPLYDDNGDPQYLLGISEDITEHKRVATVIHESQTRFRAIFDQTFQFIGLMKTDGTLIEVNRSALQFAAIREQDVLGKLFWDTPWWTHSPDLQDRLREAVRTAAGGNMVRFEATHPHSTGEIAYVDFSLKPVRDEHGNVTLLIPEGRDITDRKQAEERLTRSHDLLKSFVAHTPAAVAMLDKNLRYVNFSQRWLQDYHLGEQDLTGRHHYDVFPEIREHREWHDIHQRCLAGAVDHREEDRFVRLDGQEDWLRWEIRPWHDDSGEIGGIIMFTEVITERKRMKDALHQRERDLRAAMEERERISQDLHDGTLQSLFAVGLTLETAKLMMTPRTRKTSGAPLDQAIDQLNLVMREIRNFIAGLGSDLLEGKDLPMALQNMLASLTENQSMRVRLVVEDRAVKAVSVEQAFHLFRVIQESVSNCIRHGRAQEARVSLKMLQRGVRLSIRDNGRGFNLDAAKGSGHGLGNMAARAQKIGARFTVLSKVNEGTRIVLDLPKEYPSVFR